MMFHKLLISLTVKENCEFTKSCKHILSASSVTSSSATTSSSPSARLIVAAYQPTIARINMTTKTNSATSNADETVILERRANEGVEPNLFINQRQQRQQQQQQYQHQQQNKASLEQLISLEKMLSLHLPNFFNRPHPLTIYTQDLIFIDNIRGNKYKGIASYAIRINLFKLYHVLNYSSNKVELLNLVKNPEESYIKIRWRVISKPGIMYFLLNFWRFLSKSNELWKDGISTMIVNRDGKVYTHICDNIDVEIDEKKRSTTKEAIKNRLVNRGLNV